MSDRRVTETAVPAPSVRARSPVLDAMRAIAICLVVFQHQYRGLVSSGIASENTLFLFLDRFIYAFHVPVFFIVSGYLAQRRLARAPYPSLRAPFIEILYPYVLWTVLQSTIMIFAAGLTNRGRDWSALEWIFLYPADQFWFLYAFFFVTLIETLAFSCQNSAHSFFQSGLAAAWFRQTGRTRRVALASLGFVLYCAAVNVPYTPPIVYQAAFGLVHFMVGGIIAQTAFRADVRPKPGSTSIALAGLALLLVGTAFAVHHDIHPQYLFPLAFIGTGLVWWIAVVVPRWPDAFLILGRNTLTIFAVHTIVGAACRIGLQKGLGVQLLVPHLLLGTVVGILAPLGLIWTLERLNLKTRWLGLPPLR